MHERGAITAQVHSDRPQRALVLPVDGLLHVAVRMPFAAQRAQDEPPLVPGRARHASDLAVRGRQRGPRDLRARELEPQLLLRHHLVRVPVPGDLLHAAAAVDDVETRLPGTARAFGIGLLHSRYEGGFCIASRIAEYLYF